MSKKISEMPTKTSLVDTDFITALDNAAVVEQQNVKITKANLLQGLSTTAELNAHKADPNQHPISGVAGLQTALDGKEPVISPKNDAFNKSFGTGVDDVARGNAVINAVATHDELDTAHEGNLPTPDQKAALDANAALNVGNAVAGQDDIVDEGIDLKSTSRGINEYLVTDGFGGFEYQPIPGNSELVGGWEREDLGNQATAVNYNAASKSYGFIVTLTGNAVINAPIGQPVLTLDAYRHGMVTIVQDATGGRVPTWDAIWQNAPVLSGAQIAPNAIVNIPYTFDTDGYVLRDPVPFEPEASGVTPGSYTNTDLTVDAQGRITAAANGSGNGGASAFTDLTDTPANYVGANGQAVAVNAAGDALEFKDFPANGAVAWGDITGTLSNQTDLQGELDGKEPTISPKNSAFNKAFGAIADSVCEGNDARLSDARTPTAHASTHATGQPDALAPADIGAEPAFAKNTAFNKNWGAVADTVCQGNDARLSDARSPVADAVLDGYVETPGTGLPTTGTITVPLDGRIHEVTLTGDATIDIGAVPAAGNVGSAILFLTPAGNNVSYAVGLYWAGGAAVAAGVYMRYTVSNAPGGNKIIDAEELATV